MRIKVKNAPSIVNIVISKGIIIRRIEINGAETMQIDDDRCIRCGVCYEVCPNGAIHKSIINALDMEVGWREL